MVAFAYSSLRSSIGNLVLRYCDAFLDRSWVSKNTIVHCIAWEGGRHSGWESWGYWGYWQNQQCRVMHSSQFNPALNLICFIHIASLRSSICSMKWWPWWTKRRNWYFYLIRQRLEPQGSMDLQSRQRGKARWAGHVQRWYQVLNALINIELLYWVSPNTPFHSPWGSAGYSPFLTKIWATRDTHESLITEELICNDALNSKALFLLKFGVV